MMERTKKPLSADEWYRHATFGDEGRRRAIGSRTGLEIDSRGLGGHRSFLESESAAFGGRGGGGRGAAFDVLFDSAANDLRKLQPQRTPDGFESLNDLWREPEIHLTVVFRLLGSHNRQGYKTKSAKQYKIHLCLQRVARCFTLLHAGGRLLCGIRLSGDTQQPTEGQARCQMMTTDDLQDEFEVLSPLVKVLPIGHPVREKFELVDRMYPDFVDNPPPAALMRSARDAFFAMPLIEQRRLMNGWAPCPDRRTREEDGTPCECALARGLSIEPLGTLGKLVWSVEFFRFLSTGPVSVVVREGTLPARAVEVLRQIADTLEKHMPAIVGGPAPLAVGSVQIDATPDGSDKKSRTPETPFDSSKLGGRGIGGAESPTPAEEFLRSFIH